MNKRFSRAGIKAVVIGGSKGIRLTGKLHCTGIYSNSANGSAS